jgi:tetratricopeptide (TPR) repeat protein
MMAKDPARRYETCGEVMRHLSTVRRQGAAAPREAIAAAPARRAIPWPVIAGAAALLAVAGTAWGVWHGIGMALPAERNLAVLAPLTPGAGEDFAAFALGAIELLAARLQKHQARPGFQLASFDETYDEKVASAYDARRIQGVNLALRSTLEQRTDSFRARLELWDAKRNRVIASRSLETPISKPHEFLDRLYRESTRILSVPPIGGDAVAETGVQGAGTLRFLLLGMGRTRIAATEEQARRAVEDLENACRAEPDAGIARAWRSWAERECYRLGRDTAWLDRAVASAREAVARDSTRAEAYRFLGHALENRRDRGGAVTAFGRSVEIDPSDDATVLRLARSHAHLGQPELERKIYEATISSRPHCWQPYWWLATWHFRQGNFEESAHAYREMIRRSPDLYRGYSNLGALLILSGAYEQAIDTLNLSIALHPSEVAFDNLGTACFNTRRFQEAVNAYNQAFQFGFASYVMWANLGDAYYWLPGRRERATEAYAEAVRLGREEISKHERGVSAHEAIVPAVLSTVFPKIGQADSARAYLARALRADSTNSRIQQCAALTWWQLGDRTQALASLERAVRGGYPVAWVRDSPMFEDWRAEPAYRALITGAGPETQRSGSPGRGGRT